jgi:WD40 repeat protein
LWDRGTGQSIAEIKLYDDTLQTAQLSGDGKWAVVAMQSGLVWLWNAESGTRTMLSGHEGLVFDVDVSPADKLVATACEDGFVRLWDSTTGALLQSMSQLGRVLNVRFSPDGQSVLAVTERHSATLWNVASGEKLRSFEVEKGRFTRAKFNSDGRYIAAYSPEFADGGIQVWNVATGDPVRNLKLSGSASLNWHPAQPVLAIASSHDGVIAWDVEKDVQRQLSTDSSGSAAFSSDGTRLVTTSLPYKANPALLEPGETGDGTGEQSIDIWDFQSGERVRSIPVQDGYVLARQVDNNEVCVHKLSYGVVAFRMDNRKLLFTSTGHAATITFAVVSPDGRMLATTSRDHTVRTWDTQTGRLVHVLRGHAGAVTHAAFSPNGKLLASTSADQTCIVWDRDTGQLVRTLKGHDGQVWRCSFSPDGQQLITVSRDNTMRLWELDTQRVISTQEMEGTIVDASFSPIGKSILSIPGVKYRITKSPGGGVVLRPLPDSRSRGQQQYEVRLISPGGPSLSMPHEFLPMSGRFSPDGTRIITIDINGLAHLWNSKTGEKITSLEVPGSRIHYASFSPDGSKLFTNQGDSLAVWDGASTRPLFFIQGTSFPIGSRWPLETYYQPFSPDGKWIVAATQDRSLRRWPLDLASAARQAAPRELTPEEKKQLELAVDPSGPQP